LPFFMAISRFIGSCNPHQADTGSPLRIF